MVDQGVNSYRIGYATTVAVILFGICFVFSMLYQIFVLRTRHGRRDRSDGRLMARPSRLRGAGGPRRSPNAPVYVAVLALAAVVLVPIAYVVP